MKEYEVFDKPLDLLLQIKEHIVIITICFFFASFFFVESTFNLWITEVEAGHGTIVRQPG